MRPESSTLGSTRVALLEQSLRCFRLSWFSLIPILGLAAAVVALVAAVKALNLQKHTWNAAGPYLLAGTLISVVGVAHSVFLLTAILIVIVNQAGDGF